MSIIFENDMLIIYEDNQNIPYSVLIRAKSSEYIENACDEYKTFMTNYIEKCNYFKDTISNFSIILYLNLDAYNFKTAYAIAKNIKEFHYEKQYLTDKFIDKTIIYCKNRIIKFILTGIIKLRKMPKPVKFTCNISDIPSL